MAFRFLCPKCNTSSFNIERDSRSYAPRGQPHELIFSCRCGKQLFGDQIEKEYLRQKTAYEAATAERAQEEAVREQRARAEREKEQALRDAYEQHRAFQAKQAEAPAPAAPVAKPPTAPKPKAPPARAAKPRATAPEPDQAPTETCGWHECSNPPRPNSKYCSRDCSNKNARHRYKKRKNKDSDQAAA